MTSFTVAPLRGLALAASAVACLGLAPALSQAAELSWVGSSYLVRTDGGGAFHRRGVAWFPNNDVALMTMEGQVTQSTGGVTRYTAKITYQFPDGSTIQQEGVGSNDTRTDLLGVVEGEGRLVGGSGRFAGITGTTKSSGKGLNGSDSYSIFKADYEIRKP
jgi:hypothetical protein